MTSYETRQVILEAAAQEFVVRGYAGTSLSSIAARLDLTKGALTYHFRARSDFAHHFMRVVRGATAQAKHFAENEYPECGVCRLLLHFMTMGRWRDNEPQYRAGLVLFTDQASPEYGKDELMQEWLSLSIDAVKSSTRSGTAVERFSDLQAGEIFFLTYLGAAFLGTRLRSTTNILEHLYIVRSTLALIGVDDVDTHFEEVHKKYADRLPALDYDNLDAEINTR